MKGRAPLIAGVAALLVLGTAIVVGVFVAARSSDSSVGTAGAIPVSAAGFPAPPRDAVVFARQDGGNVLALAVRPAKQRLELQVSAVGRQGTGVTGLGVTMRVQPGASQALRGAPCGRGCYRASAQLPSRPRSVTVEVKRGARKTTWRVPIEIWPPRSASTLVSQAERTWRKLHSFQFSEHLASDAQTGIESTWRVVAPNSLSYVIEGTGNAGVVIGDQRWDRQGEKWTKSPQTPLELPQPTWRSGVTNAYVIGTATVAGKPVTRVSFYDRTGRAWFEIGVQKQSARTLQLHMTTVAHFMRQTFSRFNAPLVIKPPV